MTALGEESQPYAHEEAGNTAKTKHPSRPSIPKFLFRRWKEVNKNGSVGCLNLQKHNGVRPTRGNDGIFGGPTCIDGEVDAVYGPYRECNR